MRSRIAYLGVQWSWRWVQWSWRLKVEGQLVRPKKTWSKVVEEDKRKLNIMEDMAEDRQPIKQKQYKIIAKFEWH